MAPFSTHTVCFGSQPTVMLLWFLMLHFYDFYAAASCGWLAHFIALFVADLQYNDGLQHAACSAVFIWPCRAVLWQYQLGGGCMPRPCCRLICFYISSQHMHTWVVAWDTLLHQHAIRHVIWVQHLFCSACLWALEPYAGSAVHRHDSCRISAGVAAQRRCTGDCISDCGQGHRLLVQLTWLQLSQLRTSAVRQLQLALCLRTGHNSDILQDICE
jgi:hypothetical protein